MIVPAGYAKLTVTYQNQQGELLHDAIANDAPDETVRQWVVEAIQNGALTGIAPDQFANISDFVVERFAATPDIPYARINVRPKTAFGSITTSIST